MRVTLHQLMVFKAVAKHGSVTEASKHLHMTQPAVSNIVKQLEDYYGCALTETLSRKLYLTEYGREVLAGAEKVIEALEGIDYALQRMKGEVAGVLKVAIVSTAKYFVPGLLGRFKAQYPSVHIKMNVCNREEIIERLKENLDDFVIMSQPPEQLHVEIADFYEDELVVAAPFEHPLTHQEHLGLNDLIDEHWIIREMGSGTRIAMFNLFKKHGFIPRVEMEVSNTSAIKQAIIAGMGVSVLSLQSIRLELQANLIKTLSVHPFPVRHEWYLVKNKGKTLPPIAEAFYGFVTHHQPYFSDFH